MSKGVRSVTGCFGPDVYTEDRLIDARKSAFTAMCARSEKLACLERRYLCLCGEFFFQVTVSLIVTVGNILRVEVGRCARMTMRSASRLGDCKFVPICSRKRISLETKMSSG